MDTQPLIKYLSEIAELSKGLIKEIQDALTQELYRNHQVILAQGQVENRAWYLLKGFARSYIYDEQGQELTVKFWNEGEFIFSSAAFLKVPAPVYIEILEDSELHSIAYERILRLMSQYQETGQVVSHILKNNLTKENERHLLYALSPENRYLRLRTRYPAIFKKSPLRIIASYLLISRESLSRIINREVK